MTLDDVRGSFGLYYLALNPTYTWTHFQQKILAPVYQQVALRDPEYKRVIVNLPFRHGKTDVGTLNFIPYYFGYNPTATVILLSYGKKLARKFGRAIRDTMQKSHLYHELFPHAVVRSSSRAVDEFETVSGGTFFAGGFLDGVNGRGAHLLVIDDPIKNREEAMSDTIREKQRELYNNTVRTRLEPGAAIVINTTRWTPDDLVGWRIEEDGGYDHFDGRTVEAI